MDLEKNYFIAKDKTHYYKITPQELIPISKIEETILTKDFFVEYGVNSLEDNKMAFTKKDEISLLGVFDKEGDYFLSIKGKKNLLSIPKFQKNESSILAIPDNREEVLFLEIKGKKDLRNIDKKNESKIYVLADTERKEVPVAKVKGHTSPQVILANGDIKLEKISKVNKLELTTIGESDNIRIIYSVDSGKTWQGTGGRVVVLDKNKLDNVYKNGFTVEDFNSYKGWSDEIVKAGKIRFGYYLGMTDNQPNEIDKLEINVDYYGYWESQYTKECFEVKYSNGFLQIDLYKNGTYKINYTK